MTHQSVLVAGAGPTGLTLACDLLAAGVDVRVVDRAPGAARTSRALGLQPRGLEALLRAGALGDLERRSNPIRQVVIDLGGGTPARLRLGGATKLVTRPGLLVSQAEVETGLRRRLEDLGGQVEWSSEVVDATQDGAGVTVRISSGSDSGTGLTSGPNSGPNSGTGPSFHSASGTGHSSCAGLGCHSGTSSRAGLRSDSEFGPGRNFRCSWLVGCDGAHSRVRTLAGVGFPGVAVIERFALADVRADLPLDRDAVAVWLRGEQMLAAFPLPGADLWRLMAPVPDEEPGPLDGAQLLGLLTTQLAERTGWPAGSVRGVEWTSVFRIHRRLAERYRQGRFLLAGDAAHIHSPLGGQGMNTGIGDAENLAWKLALVARHRAGPELLDTYQDERRPIAEEVLSSTTGMTKMVLGQSPTARLLRDRVFVPALNRPLVQRLVWEQASQLKTSYARGPLGDPARRTLRHPRPGDRVPDLACRRADGSRTHLHTELGARWALLGSTATMPSRMAAGCLAVAERRLGAGAVTALSTDDRLRSELYLVRPDGHLGWRGRARPARVAGWLARVLRDDAPAGGEAEEPVTRSVPKDFLTQAARAAR